jgi:hypothetical protein
MEIVEVHVVQAMQITYRLIKLDQTHSGPPALLGLLDVCIETAALKVKPPTRVGSPTVRPDKHTPQGRCMVDYGS